MFKRGDRVRVVGYGGKSAVLRVWEDKGHGLLLCSDVGFKRAMEGGELIAVGYPASDVKGHASELEGVPKR